MFIFLKNFLQLEPENQNKMQKLEKGQIPTEPGIGKNGTTL